MLNRRYHQFYANVNYRTYPKYLLLHGKIARSKDAFPACPEGCPHMIVSFDHKELSFHKDQQREMRRSAQNELKRRQLFNQGIELLGKDFEKAVALLEESIAYELYIPEIERLVQEKHKALDNAPQIRAKLLKLFTKAYSDKFGWRKYERLPELMRISREQYGIKRLQELLG